MSSAVYPLGMRSYPASGYTHKSSAPDQYVSWKGTGLSKTPLGVTAGSMRPLTNKDYWNTFQGAFGKPRPIKHSRKGSLPRVSIEDIAPSVSSQEYIEIDRNLNRDVRSSTKGTLVSQMITNPGGYSVKENTLDEKNANCGGICVSANYYPNVRFLTNNPLPSSQTPTFCCNEERKARRRALPASTNLSKNYKTTHIQLLEDKCKTFKQNSFNYIKVNTSGDTSLPDTYFVPQCYCPTSSCGRVIYKPNNSQFAQRGAVSSSTYNLRLNQNAINTSNSNLPKNEIIYKNKSEPCNPAKSGKMGNSKSCPMFAIYTPAKNLG